MEICPFGCVANKNLPSFPSKSNNILLDNGMLGELQPACVLEVCARHSITDCFNHTENTCFPTDDGCRLA
jgi:hypothetical protein